MGRGVSWSGVIVQGLIRTDSVFPDRGACLLRSACRHRSAPRAPRVGPDESPTSTNPRRRRRFGSSSREAASDARRLDHRHTIAGARRSRHRGAAAVARFAEHTSPRPVAAAIESGRWQVRDPACGRVRDASIFSAARRSDARQPPPRARHQVDMASSRERDASGSRAPASHARIMVRWSVGSAAAAPPRRRPLPMIRKAGLRARRSPP